MTGSDWVSVRFRLLIAAEAAHRIATTTHRVVLHDEETYELVRSALASMKSDVRTLIAELEQRGEADERAIGHGGGVRAVHREPAPTPGSLFLAVG
jgi:hypothetical protein